MKCPLALIAVAAAAPALAADGPSLVPADAVGFAHVRAREVWRDDSIAMMRKVVGMAGGKVLAALDRRFTPAPSTLDTVTAFMAGGIDNPLPVGIFTFTKPVDRGRFLAGAIPGVGPLLVAGRGVQSYYQVGPFAFAFPDAKTIVVGPPPAVAAMRPTAAGPLAAALRAAPRNDITVAFNMKAVPPQMLAGVPREARPLLDCSAVTLTMNLRQQMDWELRANYPDAAAAARAERTLKGLTEVARRELKKFKPGAEKMALGEGEPAALEELPQALAGVMALGGLNHLDGVLADPPVELDGSDLKASVAVPKELFTFAMNYTATAAGLLLPAMQKVREAAARLKSANNMMQIAVALHDYHDVNGRFPPAVIRDKAGKPLYSWRVAVLPFIEQNNVFNQFDRTKPWDHPANRRLSSLRIPTFESPAGDFSDAKFGMTNYRVVAAKGGPRTAFAMDKGIKLVNLTNADGTAFTVAFVETAEAVPWAKPAPLFMELGKPVPKFGGLFKGGFHVAMCDGTVQFLPDTLSQKTLRGLLTAFGGEVVELP